jgi:hypothetical protein
MSRRLLWINLTLLLIVVFLAFKDYGDWAQPGSKTKETALSKPKPQAAGLGVALLVKKEEPPPPTRYKTISEKNVFNPDRKEFPPPPLRRFRRKRCRRRSLLSGRTLPFSVW